MVELQPNGSLSSNLSDRTLAISQPEPLGLCYLPVELLDAIVASLDLQSLCTLALTCKATKTCALQALYATYVNRDAPSKTPFHLFLRTLCERPDLAALVKMLDIRGWRSEFEVATGVEWQGVTKIRKEDKTQRKRTGPMFVSASKVTGTPQRSLRLFERTVGKIGLISQDQASHLVVLKKKVIAGEALEDDNDFVRLLRHGVEDAQVVLMLALLPNLAKLYVDGMSTYSTLDWHRFLCRSTTALRALRTLDIRGALPQHHRSVHTTTLSFLELTPDLNHLHLSHVNITDPRQTVSLMSNKGLQCFSAHLTQVDRQTLRSLLSGHKIENFHYRPGIGKLTKDIAAKFGEDDIVDSLKGSKDSLRNFTLYSTKPSQAPVLSQFKNLDTMEMPYRGGFFDKLDGSTPQEIAKIIRKRVPRSLSVLQLRFIQPVDDVTVPMEVLTDLKLRGELPALKTVHLNFSRQLRIPWLPPAAMVFADIVSMAGEALSEMFEQAGLKLELAQTD